MKSIIFYKLSIIIYLLFIYSTLSAQITDVKQNWQNLDLKKDGVFGISTEKANSLLLNGKKRISVIVAVIDGGVDIDHEDLTQNIWKNPNEIPNNGKDDDKNGFIDDVHGWNFMGSTKGSFHTDNIDLVRELRTERKINPNSIKARKLQADLNSIRIPMQNIYLELHEKRQILNTIVNNIGKITPSLDDFKHYHYKNEQEAFTLYWIVQELKKDAEFLKKFEDRYGNYNSQVNYWTNLDYDPRGNNPEYQNKGYGNPDVKGTGPDHGTFVTGILAGERENGKGMDGVADQVRVMVLRTVPAGDYLDLDMANAIRYATDNGAKIINISINKPTSTHRKLVDEAVKYAISKDVLIIHGAGNEGKRMDSLTNFPSKIYENGGQATAWLEVGASSSKDDQSLLAWFSNYGKMVDVSAPGVSIYSTFPNNKYGIQSGTSMSTPVVAGLAAIIRSYYPSLTATHVKDIIMKSVERVSHSVRLTNGTSIPFSEVCSSGGIINAFKALSLAEEMKSDYVLKK
ncbi:S8 family serine peptidase [Pedobacter sp. AW31-3R]|uniref:S8 family serine peptidase n=1 Tax=Pedobacter sp. AW31-3R TaxID=3445781 RepID=UPI003FA04C58